MPPKRPTLAPIVDPGSDAKKTTEAGEKLEITDTMSLVVSSGGEQYVVRESGFEKTPSTSLTPQGGGGGSGGNSYANANNSNSSGARLGAGGSQRVVASPASTLSSSSNANNADSNNNALPTSMLGRIKFDQLELLDIIGHGSQGRVRKVKNRMDGTILALKSIAFSSDIEPLRKALVHELERITAFKHPNVVSSFEAYFRNGKMYVLMEFMDCGTLTDVARKVIKMVGPTGLNDAHVAYIARDVLEGMAHIHKELVMHRDIKPANMLCNSEGRVKISDFGVAGDAHVQVHHTTVGSTPYMSPERIKALPYTQACDIWSIGISIAEISIGEYPFGQKNKGKVFDLAEIITSEKAECQWSLNPQKQFAPELKDFVAQCLLPQDRRPTAEALLGHPFITKFANTVSREEMGKLFASTSSNCSKPSSSSSTMPASLSSNASLSGVSSPSMNYQDSFAGAKS